MLKKKKKMGDLRENLKVCHRHLEAQPIFHFFFFLLLAAEVHWLHVCACMHFLLFFPE